MISDAQSAIAAALAGLAMLSLPSWLLWRHARKRVPVPTRSHEDLEILAGEIAELVDVARFINNGFQDDNFYAIRSKYAVIVRCLQQHPVYSRYVDARLGATAEAGLALPLSMLRQEDKECLLVTLRELQGCVQILINLRDAGCLPGAERSEDGNRSGGPPLVVPPAPRPVRTRGPRAAVAAATAAVVLLAGAAVLLSRDDAAVSVETLLAQAGRNLRGIGGLQSGEPDGGAGHRAGSGEVQGGDLTAQSRRLTAEMEALDRAVVQRRDELDLVGASVARLRLAAEAGQASRQEAEAARAAADAGAAEARAGIEAVTREMAALRAQVAEQREALEATRTEADAARTALTTLRAGIAEQAGRMEEARAAGEAEIRQLTDRLSELGQTAQTNREAIGRIAGTLVGFQETSRDIAAARDQLFREQTHLADLASGGSEAGRSLSEIKVRIAALKVALAGTASQDLAARAPAAKEPGTKDQGVKDQGVKDPAAALPVAPVAAAIAAAPPRRTEAALQPDEWRRIQQALVKAGHYAGKTDGQPGEGTRAAIAKYQRGLGADATGRLTSSQIERLIPTGPVKPPAKQPMAAR